jgi:hypothetical protein
LIAASQRQSFGFQKGHKLLIELPDTLIEALFIFGYWFLAADVFGEDHGKSRQKFRAGFRGEEFGKDCTGGLHFFAVEFFSR